MKNIHVLAAKACCEKRTLLRSEIFIEKQISPIPVSSPKNAR
jgi:hypothetical protein